VQEMGIGWPRPFRSIRHTDAARPAGYRPLGVFKAAALAGLSLSLGGCIPSADVPNTALEIAPSYRFAGATPAAPPRVEWWTSFRSAELNRFMEEAVGGNFDVEAAVGRIVQADALSRQTGAALLPSLTMSDNVSRSQAANFPGSPTVRRWFFQPTLSASYQIDFWGKNRAAFQATQETAFAARFDRETVLLSALASTSSTYFAVLGARERAQLARDNLKLAADILSVIKNRVVVGTATALAQAQQEALVANIRASIPPLQQIADQNVAQLALLIGRAPEHITVAGAAISKLGVPKIQPGLPSEVILQRPDIQNAEAQLAAAHANLVSARAAFFPNITLTGQGGFQSLALSTLFLPSSGFYSLAGNLTQPIFDAGLLQAQFDQRQGIQDELVATYKKTVITAFSDVEKALIALHDLGQQEELLKVSLTASQKAYDLSVDQLKAGTLDIVILLQTQQTLFTTRDSLSQVHLARLQAAISLYQALGGGWVASKIRPM